MITTLFVGFVTVMVAVVVAVSARYLNGRAAFGVLGGLCMWFIYVGLMAYFGVVQNTAMRPPGIAFIVVPVIVFLIIFIVRSFTDAGVALSFPLWIILGTQCFRVGVELFLHQLWIDGLAPKMLTFAGANVDIYVGASAPLIAWLSTRGRLGIRLALTWNLLGLLALANVVIRAVLTAPGAIQPDPCRSSQSDVRNVPIHVYSRIFRASGGCAARSCNTGHQQPAAHGNFRCSFELSMNQIAWITSVWRSECDMASIVIIPPRLTAFALSPKRDYGSPPE